MNDEQEGNDNSQFGGGERLWITEVLTVDNEIGYKDYRLQKNMGCEMEKLLYEKTITVSKRKCKWH